MSQVREPALVRAGAWVVCPLLGGGVALLVVSLADVLLGLPWVPFEGPIELVASIPQPWAGIGAAAVGVIAGLVFAALWTRDRLEVDVAPEQVRLRRGATTRRFDRTAVTTTFRDGKHLVLVDGDGDELAREKSDLGGTRLRDAFVEQGWPWADADPHAERYQLWVDGDPRLPVAADVLLRARAKALCNVLDDEANELRHQLARIGVLVREDKARQYWRARW